MISISHSLHLSQKTKKASDSDRNSMFCEAFEGIITEILKESTTAEKLFIGVPWSFPHYHQIS